MFLYLTNTSGLKVIVNTDYVISFRENGGCTDVIHTLSTGKTGKVKESIKDIARMIDPVMPVDPTLPIENKKFSFLGMRKLNFWGLSD